MEFNRWDIVIAHYVFYTLYHNGQWSREYSRLSKIMNYFKPSPLGINLEDDGNENALEIFLHLCEKNDIIHQGEIRH